MNLISFSTFFILNVSCLETNKSVTNFEAALLEAEKIKDKNLNMARKEENENYRSRVSFYRPCLVYESENNVSVKKISELDVLKFNLNDKLPRNIFYDKLVLTNIKDCLISLRNDHLYPKESVISKFVESVIEIITCQQHPNLCYHKKDNVFLLKFIDLYVRVNYDNNFDNVNQWKKILRFFTKMKHGLVSTDLLSNNKFKLNLNEFCSRPSKFIDTKSVKNANLRSVVCSALLEVLEEN